MDEIGDGLFLLFARDFAPLPERLASMASRMEAAPQALREHRERVGDDRVRLWDEMELEQSEQIGTLFDEIAAAGVDALGADSPEQARLLKAADEAKAAVREYADWLRATLDRGGDDFALGRERYDRLVELREFDGLTSDEILAIGEEQLATNRAARAEVASRIDPDATEEEVLARVKADHPADFATALEAYRESMGRARQHVIDRDLATLPEGEHVSVVETPPYLRNVMPFAAYFPPCQVRPRFRGHLHGHALGRRRRAGRCASTTTPRSPTPASTRRIPATTSSWRPRCAIRASPGCWSTRPSSSRAGACTRSS